jgi:hypothetical protein
MKGFKPSVEDKSQPTDCLDFMPLIKNIHFAYANYIYLENSARQCLFSTSNVLLQGRVIG